MGHPHQDTPLAQPPNCLKEVGAAAVSTPDSDFAYSQAGTAKNASEFQKCKLDIDKDHNIF